MAVCITCQLVFKAHRSSYGWYCSNTCHSRHQYIEYVKRWLSGGECGWVGKTRVLSKHIRRYLHETVGTACEECGWDCKHPLDGAVLTEIDHVDGNAENCIRSNLKILCPNCHSMTSTFRNRNKGSSKRIRNAPIV